MSKKVNGVFIGKFMPLHLGHVNAILEAATMCDKLYVVVSHDNDFMLERCEKHGLKPMPLETRMMWLHKEFKDFDHIKIVGVDETGIETFPNGWVPWSKLVRKALIEAGVKQSGFADKAADPVDIQICFGSELGYELAMKTHFNSAIEYKMIDLKRQKVEMSATELITDVYKYWEFLPGSVREHFVKKVLVVGTESCGKTTVVRKLAKSFLTSWSEEYGKYYESTFMGSYSENWTVDDFNKIAMTQLSQDYKAYTTANKVVFIDTDAIVTDYYLDMYLGKKSEVINALKAQESDKWDLVVLLQPTVPFVQDGTRWEKNKEIRWELHNKLKNMFDEQNVEYVEIGGDYHHRFTTIRSAVKELLKGG